MIYDIAADNDNVRVIDWAAETADDPALLGGDGLHLSDPGRARFADMVGRASSAERPASARGRLPAAPFTDDSAVTIPAVDARPRARRRTTRRGRWRRRSDTVAPTAQPDPATAGRDAAPPTPATDAGVAAAAADAGRRRRAADHRRPPTRDAAPPAPRPPRRREPRRPAPERAQRTDSPPTVPADRPTETTVADADADGAEAAARRFKSDARVTSRHYRAVASETPVGTGRTAASEA